MSPSSRNFHWAYGCLLKVLVASALCLISGAHAEGRLREERPGALDVSVPYRVEIRGAGIEKLRAALRSASGLVALQSKPPATRDLLARRVERDIAKLTELLKSQGYYDANVTSRTDDTVQPIRIILQVDPGKVYTVSSVEIRTAPTPAGESIETRKPSSLQSPASSPTWPEFSDLPLKAGQPVRTQQVLDTEKRVLQILKKHGYPLPQVTKRTVELDRGATAAVVTYFVAPGPKGRFGPTSIEGLESVDESFVRNRIPWKERDAFNGDKIRKLEENLVKSSLFSLVKVTTGSELGPNGTVSTNIKLAERKHRTVSGSVMYKTDEGPGAKVGWENRNLFGHGEKLELGAGISNISDSFEAAYTKPDFLRPDQSLVLSSRFALDRPEAYTSVAEKLSAGVERKLTDRTKIGLGTALKISKVDQLDTTRHYGLLSLPLYLHYENSNDPLEPIRGGRLHLELAPIADVLNGNATFFKSQVDVSRYFDILEKPLSVIAGRISLGAILGEDRYDVPADERFYAGGSNSIRGYAYQLAGPLEGSKPVGGKSMLAASCEYRLRVRERIDVIAFVDAGNAYSKEVPDIGDLKFGSGLGVGYYSKIGPIRLDVAFPLERRSGIDDAFQVYVNLGQSF